MIYEETTLKYFRLYCPKCKLEKIIDVEQGKIDVSVNKNAVCGKKIKWNGCIIFEAWYTIINKSAVCGKKIKWRLLWR